ncbi:MAG: hypothetical protein AAGJ46_09190 [Planctomycetota bacterium]
MSDTPSKNDPNLARVPEGGVEDDDLDTGSIVTIGLISTALLIASVLGVTALVDRFENAEANTQAAEQEPLVVVQNDGGIVYDTPDGVEAEQKMTLAEYTATDSGFTIPIERAKMLVLKELKEAKAEEDGGDEPKAKEPDEA